MKNNRGFTQPVAKLQAGFTVMELMIATAVFSIILLLSLAGFLQIGQLFYKGVNITRTADDAKQVISSLKTDISFDFGSTNITVRNSRLTTPPTDRWYFCAGPNRYTYILGRQLNTAAESNEMKSFPVSGWNKFALLKDTVTPPACPDPFNSGAAINTNNVTELLGDRMRLSNLTITSIGNTLYTLNVKIAYGDNDVLDNPSTPSAKCKSGAVYSRYCFVTDTRTTVRRGIAP